MSRRSFAAGTAACGLGMLGDPAAASNRSAPRMRALHDPGRQQSFGTTLDDLSARDYVEHEVLLEGEALSFLPDGALNPDGRWNLRPGESRPYAVRMMVRRPRDWRRCNGTVILEWLNVSFGFDMSFTDSPGLYDSGFIWVGLSAQYAGIHGLGERPQGLKAWNPTRYTALSHPGDDWSFDIFTQAARALRTNRGRAHPLKGCRVRRIIGTGASQSGSRLLSYANGLQPREHAFDALMPLICAGAGAGFTGGADARNPVTRGRPVFTRVRSDLAVPVVQLNTEYEAPFFRPHRQDDSALYRSWEIAGASHGPTEQLRTVQAKERRDGVRGPWHDWDESSDVAWLPTLEALFVQVHRWLNGGAPVGHQPPIAFLDDGHTIARDAHGNALGGVRLPELEAPAASYLGNGRRFALAGETHRFDAARLRALYPGRPDYLARTAAAAAAALAAGTIPARRVAEYVRRAEALDWTAAAEGQA